MATANATSARSHVQVWRGSETARVTDMTNAGKRGKTCRVLRFSGWHVDNPRDEECRLAQAATRRVIAYLFALLREQENHEGEGSSETDFDTIRTTITNILAEYDSLHVRCYDEEIQAIRAPRQRLTAGVEGKWSARASEDGVTIDDLSDRINEPCCITSHGQSRARAYSLAAKVWHQVAACQTFSEATNVLSDAGCKLHYFCRVD